MKNIKKKEPHQPAESISLDDLLGEIQKIKLELDIMMLKRQCRTAPISPNFRRREADNPCLQKVDWGSATMVLATPKSRAQSQSQKGSPVSVANLHIFCLSSVKHRTESDMRSPERAARKKDFVEYSPYSPIGISR